MKRGFKHNKRWYDANYTRMNKKHITIFLMLIDILPATIDGIREELEPVACELDSFFRQNSSFYRMDDRGNYFFVGDGKRVVPIAQIDGVDIELKYDLDQLAEIPQAGAEIPQALAESIQEGADTFQEGASDVL